MEKKVRLVTLTAIAAIVVACGLLAIPQFIVQNDYRALGSISGYQFFFHAVGEVYEKKSGLTTYSGLGITAFAIMLVALALYVFGSFKKFASAKSALMLFGGLCEVASAIMFFCMEPNKSHLYGGNRTLVTVGWVAYVIGALLIITGLVAVYFAIKSMQTEKKEIVGKKSYSYLKK